MAKGNPLRLDSELMRAAKACGELMHRSEAEQIEFWADLGRSLESLLDQRDLLDIRAGLASLKIEPTKAQPVDPSTLFAQVDAQRSIVAQSLAPQSVQYRASRTHPGLLDAVMADGSVKVGQFKNGRFVANDQAA